MSTPPTTPSSEEQQVFAPSGGATNYGSGPSYGPGGGSSVGGVAQQVPNRLVPAIILTAVSLVLAFFTFGIAGIGVITGIIAIVFAAQVNGKAAAGDYRGAQQASKTARILNLVTLGIVILGVLIAIVLIVIFVIALSQGA